jgi:hypothetical protein
MSRPSLPLLAASLALVLPAAPAAAQLGYRYVEVYGTDACPSGGQNEIVVCARKKDGDRYRIPEALRTAPQDASGPSESWAARATSFEYVGRTGIQSCSAAGAGGETGCTLQLIRQAKAERLREQEAAAQVP